MKSNNRKMWQYPWGYKESIATVIGFILIGCMLQWTLGGFNLNLIHSPLNIILGILIIIFLGISAIYRNRTLFRWFSGIPMAVTLISALLVLGVIMGLTPQYVPTHHSHHIHENLATKLGFTQMTTSWAFIFVYLLTLLSLGMLIVRRLIPFRKKDYAFYLNHIGLWIILFAAGLGSADIKKYVMYIREGEVEWRVYNEKQDVLELPIAIQLNDFYMEEYPPKLAIINRETGAVQPENKPDYFQIDKNKPKGKLSEWDITLKEYIHNAVRNSDSTYQEVYMPGASPAAKVLVQNKNTGEEKEGWICAGNIAQLYMVLNLNDNYCVVMTNPEPKRFVSDINVFTQNGKEAHTLLEVNKPLKIGSWMLYQYGYDTEAGKLSTYSGIELVYDPWVNYVYFGIVLLGIGSVCMLWAGKKRKNTDYEME